MLITIYWYGVGLCVLSTMILAIKIKNDPRMIDAALHSEKYNIYGGNPAESLLSVILICLAPLLHWVAFGLNLYMVVSDELWEYLIAQMRGDDDEQ